MSSDSDKTDGPPQSIAVRKKVRDPGAADELVSAAGGITLVLPVEDGPITELPLQRVAESFEITRNRGGDKVAYSSEEDVQQNPSSSDSSDDKNMILQQNSILSSQDADDIATKYPEFELEIMSLNSTVPMDRALNESFEVTRDGRVRNSGAFATIPEEASLDPVFTCLSASKPSNNGRSYFIVEDDDNSTIKTVQTGHSSRTPHSKTGRSVATAKSTPRSVKSAKSAKSTKSAQSSSRNSKTSKFSRKSKGVASVKSSADVSVGAKSQGSSNNSPLSVADCVSVASKSEAADSISHVPNQLSFVAEVDDENPRATVSDDSSLSPPEQSGAAPLQEAIGDDGALDAMEKGDASRKFLSPSTMLSQCMARHCSHPTSKEDWFWRILNTVVIIILIGAVFGAIARSK